MKRIIILLFGLMAVCLLSACGVSEKKIVADNKNTESSMMESEGKNNEKVSDTENTDGKSEKREENGKSCNRGGKYGRMGKINAIYGSDVDSA